MNGPKEVWETVKSLPAGQKAFFAIFILTLLLTFLSLLACSFLMALWVVGKASGHYWAICFWLCLVAVFGWIVPSLVQLRWGDGVMVFRNNVIAFWLVFLATILSALFAFVGTSRYFVVAGVVGSVGLLSFFNPIFISGLRLLVKKRPLKGSLRGTDQDP